MLNKVPQPYNAQPAAHPRVPARVGCGVNSQQDEEKLRALFSSLVPVNLRNQLVFPEAKTLLGWGGGRLSEGAVSEILALLHGIMVNISSKCLFLAQLGVFHVVLLKGHPTGCRFQNQKVPSCAVSAIGSCRKALLSTVLK